MLARDRQIPALRGEISAENGDLSIPFEQTGYPLNAYRFSDITLIKLVGVLGLRWKQKSS
jgi:hypothetical protein